MTELAFGTVLSNVSDWLALGLFVLVPAALAIGIHAVIRPLTKGHLAPHHDVSIFLGSIVSILYAVVLGFLVVTVWSNFDVAQQTADLEAGFVADAFGAAYALPEPQRSLVRQDLASYAIRVHDVEWPILGEMSQDDVAKGLLARAIRAVNIMPPSNSASPGQVLRREFVRNGALDTLHQIADKRRLRLVEARNRLPRSMWVALLVGAVMVMAFVFMFEVENAVLQFVMTGLVAGCIGLLLGLVVELNSPYGGAIRVSPDTWSFVIQSNHFANPLTINR
jgi:hypothetical protein